MDLNALRVQHYRSLEDTGWVDIEELTCLIGKNESGKTAFMRAVEKLNPAHGTDGYTPYAEYPRQEWPEYREQHEEEPAVVASGRFELEDPERAAVDEEFTEGLLADPEITVHRDYQNELRWELEFEEEATIEYLLEAYEFEDEVRSALRDHDSLSALPDRTHDAVVDTLDGDPATVLAAAVGETVLAERLPEFRFLGEYSVMNGTIDIEALLDRRESDALDQSDQVFCSLLSVAGLELEQLREVEDWRETTTELEAASATVSEQAMDYWSQSGDIRIEIQRAGSEEEAVLEVRVQNRDHDVTVAFEQRSHGFRRFFSTFCQLADMRRTDRDLVLLLDEPGLNLHARAKEEFLEFLKTEVATSHPTIYTAHSPFLIDKETVHRTRLVMADPVGEENIISDVRSADAYTQFPLRNVFELDLMDTLLVQPQTLLVEHKADHVFLYVLSKMLRDAGKTGLDRRWTVIPVTNGRNVRPFVSLFGEDSLDVAAFLTEQPEWNTDRERLERNPEPDTLDEVPVTLVSEYGSLKEGSTVEDILSTEFYLEIVNQRYATSIREAGGTPDRLTEEELDGSGPIVEQLETYFERHDINDGEFERNGPALYLQRNRDDLAAQLDKTTRRNVTQLFTDLNNVLRSFESIQSQQESFFGSLFG